jgi:tight adherence protein C
MSPALLILPMLAGLAAGGAAWVAGGAVGRISTTVTLADGRTRERRLPILIRLFLPFATAASRLFRGRFWDASRERNRRLLTAGGYASLVSPAELLALKLVLPLSAGVPLCALLYAVFLRMPPAVGPTLLERQGLITGVILLWMFFVPTLWIRGVVRARHRQIERALPFVLDLLTLSVESGLDFMTALRRIIERRDVDALGEELVQVFREIQVGRTRREALRDFAARTDHPDVRSVTQALIQADELGSSIGRALRVQAGQMRTRRYQRAEKQGNEAPVKMLFPLVACIFPAVFLILLGPVILHVLQQGF